MTFNVLRQNKNPDGIPTPIWPKYVGDNLSDQVPNRNVQIMKQRFYQQKQPTVECDDISEISQRKIGTIVNWLENVRKVNN